MQKIFYFLIFNAFSVMAALAGPYSGGPYTNQSALNLNADNATLPDALTNLGLGYGKLPPLTDVDLSALVTSAAGVGGTLRLPPGTYTLSGDVTIPAGNFRLIVDPGSVFSGAGLFRSDNLVNTPAPVFSNDAQRFEVGSAYDGYLNVFLGSRMIVQNGSTAAAVAWGPSGILNTFGGGNGNAWAENPSCTANISTGNCYVIESNPVSLAAGAKTYGITVNLTGTHDNYIGYRLIANNGFAGANYGFVIGSNSVSPIQSTGTLFLISGTYESANGFNISGGTFTTSEWSSPNLYMGATTSGFDGSTGARPQLSAAVNGAGNPLPTLSTKLGSGATQSDLGVLATSSGKVKIQTGTLASPSTVAEFSGGAADYFTFVGSASTPTISTNAGTLTITGGGGSVNITGNVTAQNLFGGWGSTNYTKITGGSGATTIEAAGTGAANIRLLPLSTGLVQFLSANSWDGTPANCGGGTAVKCLIVKDDGGTTRKIPAY